MFRNESSTARTYPHLKDRNNFMSHNESNAARISKNIGFLRNEKRKYKKLIKKYNSKLQLPYEYLDEIFIINQHLKKLYEEQYQEDFIYLLLEIRKYREAKSIGLAQFNHLKMLLEENVQNLRKVNKSSWTSGLVDTLDTLKSKIPTDEFHALLNHINQFASQYRRHGYKGLPCFIIQERFQHAMNKQGSNIRHDSPKLLAKMYFLQDFIDALSDELKRHNMTMDDAKRTLNGCVQFLQTRSADCKPFVEVLNDLLPGTLQSPDELASMMALDAFIDKHSQTRFPRHAHFMQSMREQSRKCSRFRLNKSVSVQHYDQLIAAKIYAQQKIGVYHLSSPEERNIDIPLCPLRLV